MEQGERITGRGWEAVDFNIVKSTRLTWCVTVRDPDIVVDYRVSQSGSAWERLIRTG